MVSLIHQSFEESLILHRAKVLLGIFLFALLLRVIYHYSAVMVEPSIRADALKYIITAINLVDFGVYSYETQQPLLSSTLLVPGYPWFLALVYYFSGDVNQTINIVLHLQLVLGALIPVFTFLVAKQFLPSTLAFIAALILIIYPHQITASSYLLTETLFSFLIIVSVYLLLKGFEQKRCSIYIMFALIFAWATLIRPIPVLMCPFLLILLWRNWPDTRVVLSILSICILVVYSLWGVWGSHYADKQESNMRAVIALGSYPDFTFQNVRGFPQSEDPRFTASHQSWNALITYIKERYQAEPEQYTRWYLLGKPRSIWGFDIIQGQGGPFIYPVESSVYNQKGLYYWSYLFIQKVHQPAAMVALIFAIFTLMKTLFRRASENVLTPTVLSGYMVYITFFHVPLASLPRFSIPFQSIMIILLITAGYQIYGKIRKTSHDYTDNLNNN